MKYGPDISNFVVDGKASVLFDGQFGSTGKGLAAAWIGESNKIDWCVTNASANAGHTTILGDRKIVSFHIPSAFHTAREHGYPVIYIDAGAIVDIDVLNKEIEDLGITHSQIIVNPNAAVILDEDKEAENVKGSSTMKVASTKKGVGHAASRKVMRSGPNLGQYLNKTGKKRLFQLDTVSLNRELAEGKSVLVEVPQGFSLSLNAGGFYPYCTSRDCTPQQGLSDAGIHPRFFGKSMAVLRTFPIRVGNTQDGQGRQTGYSGPGYRDQHETNWDEVGVPPEVTTVTGRVRRVFSFSALQYQAMLEHCMPDYVFLNFCNYFHQRRKVEEIVDAMVREERKMGYSTLKFYGYGAASCDISEYIR